MGELNPKLQPNPEASANIFSRVTYIYIVPFLLRGFKKQLEEDDLCEPLPQHRSETATRNLTVAWENEKKRAEKFGRKPSLFSAVAQLYIWRAWVLGVLLLIEEIVRLSQPLMIGRLVRYFRSDSPLTLNEAYFAAAAIAISGILCPILHHPYFYGLQKLGMELKISSCGVIMQKSLRLSSGALHRTTIGHIVTLMSNDVVRFDLAFLFINYLWIGPLMLAGYIAMLWHEIGISCLAGFLVLILFVPIQGYFSRRMGNCRKLIAAQTDKRVSVMDEILNGIRVVKMYAWEGAFANVVADLRRKELDHVRESTIWQSLIMGTFWGSIRFIILASILCYLVLGNQLSAERVFVTAALFNACRMPLTLFVPFAILHMSEAKVSLDRIQSFLGLEEFQSLDKPDMNGCNNNGVASKSINSDMRLTPLVLSTRDHDLGKLGEAPFVALEKFSATWEDKEVENPTHAVRNVSFSAQSGELVAIIGPVGCGKSSVLSSILSETRRLCGERTVKGSVAYASQDPWLFSGTVRDNILFGKPYDEELYREAIRVCCLKRDLLQLPQGDLSRVGDRGHSLSGGQKARVSLARAVYSNADIYLLDDPLSAVDSIVGRYLFKKCIMGFLKNKVTILVTHQTQFLHNADLVVLMQDGEMVASGTVEELNKQRSFADILQETAKSYSRQASECEDMPPAFPSSKPLDVDMVLEEIEEDDEEEAFITARDERSPLITFATARSTLQSPARKQEQKASAEKHVLRFGSQSSTTKSEAISESSLSLVFHHSDELALEQSLDLEDRAAGAVSWRIYALYMKSMAHPAACMFLAVAFAVVVQIFDNFVDWWLNKWSNASEKAILSSNATSESLSMNLTSNDSRIGGLSNSLSFADRIDFGIFCADLNLYDYKQLFIIMTAIFMIVSIIRCMWFRVTQLVGSRLLHNQMFEAIVKSPISFFDKNPIGRILNRFSKDVDMMDVQLSFVFFEFFTGTLNVLGTVVVIILINRSVFLPFVPIVVLFLFVRNFYLASSRDVKRLEATTRSPLYSHISAVMHGLPTVRAFASEPLAMKMFCQYQDINSAAFYLSLSTARWFASTIDWVVGFFISLVAFSCIFTSAPMEGGEVALMLVYVVRLTGFFSWIMRQSAEVQNGMVSVERIVNYTRLPTENLSQGVVPSAEWPSAGHIVLQRVSLRYQKDGESVLNNIDVDILPREKIGIVGRTGAGKSSLLRVLFRLVEPEGSVLIDDLDTKKVALKELRKRLSIIPQDPVLFIGSLRRNLDPFEEYSDDKLWNALEQVSEGLLEPFFPLILSDTGTMQIVFCFLSDFTVELKTFVSNLPSTLETHMKEGGANFSVGQRQLICLARAILRCVKIIVIDEATANVDPETDTLIQRTIKKNFADCTVLTVAHRLHTIMDSDKVMVLANGVLVEYDHPHVLLQNEFGVFSSLVAETGKGTAETLKKQAATSFGTTVGGSETREVPYANSLTDGINQ